MLKEKSVSHSEDNKWLLQWESTNILGNGLLLFLLLLFPRVLKEIFHHRFHSYSPTQWKEGTFAQQTLALVVTGAPQLTFLLFNWPSMETGWYLPITVYGLKSHCQRKWDVRHTFVRLYLCDTSQSLYSVFSILMARIRVRSKWVKGGHKRHII